MKRRYLKDVTTLPDYILQVDFVSGSRLLLDMKPYLDKIRFLSLADKNVWSSAVTNGIFVRFGDVELSHDEILSMSRRELPGSCPRPDPEPQDLTGCRQKRRKNVYGWSCHGIRRFPDRFQIPLWKCCFLS